MISIKVKSYATTHLQHPGIVLKLDVAQGLKNRALTHNKA